MIKSECVAATHQFFPDKAINLDRNLLIQSTIVTLSSILSLLFFISLSKFSNQHFIASNHVRAYIVRVWFGITHSCRNGCSKHNMLNLCVVSFSYHFDNEIYLLNMKFNSIRFCFLFSIFIWSDNWICNSCIDLVHPQKAHKNHEIVIFFLV